MSTIERDDTVLYLGRIDNILGLYGLTEVLVLPSLHEGFPYSVLEAQSCGVPALVTNVTGNSDAIVANESGVLVKVNDTLDLIEKLEKLLDNKSRQEEMGIAARKTVLNNFSQNVVIGNLVNYYKKYCVVSNI